MMMNKMNYYEESMPIATKTDDYLQYFLNEGLSEQEKINHYLKKSLPFQKEYLFSHMNLYLNYPHLLNQILSITCPAIAIWEESIQLAFPSCLSKLINEIVSNRLFISHKDIIAAILFHIIKSIISTRKVLRNQYVTHFSLIIESLSQDKNNKLDLNENIIDYALSIGKVNLKNKQAKLSAFICSSLLRIIKSNTNELINRLNQLFLNKNAKLKYQLSYDSILLLRDSSDPKTIEAVIQIIKKYSNEESSIIKANSIRAIVDNWNKWLKHTLENDDYNSKYNMINDIITNIAIVFNNSDNYDNCIDVTIELYKSLIDFLSRDSIISQLQSAYDNNALRMFIEKESLQLFINNYLYSNKHKQHKELNVIVSLLPKEILVINLLTGNSTSLTDRFNEKIFSLIKETNDFDQLLYYKQLEIISPILSQSLLNTILNEADISLALNNTFPYLVYAFKSNTNEVSLNLFMDNISKTEFSKIPVMNLPFVLQGIQKLIEVVYSKANIKKKEEFYTKMIFKCKTLIKLNKGMFILSEVMKVLIQIIKYSLGRDEVIDYCLQYRSNLSFYKRRLFLIFLKESFIHFSINFLYEKGIWDKYLSLLSSTTISIELGEMIDFLQIDKLALVSNDKKLYSILNTIQQLSFNDYELLKKISKLYLLMEKERSIKNTQEQQRYLIEDQRKYREELDIGNKEMNNKFQVQYKPPSGLKGKIKTIRNSNKLPPVSIQKTMGNGFKVILRSKDFNHSELNNASNRLHHDLSNSSVNSNRNNINSQCNDIRSSNNSRIILSSSTNQQINGNVLSKNAKKNNKIILKKEANKILGLNINSNNIVKSTNNSNRVSNKNNKDISYPKINTK